MNGTEAEASNILRIVTPPLAVQEQTPSLGADDIAIVASAQVSTTEALPVTGVMSPNGSRALSPGSNAAEETVLDWRRVWAPCTRCEALVADPSICAYCGIYGHALCLNIEEFQGYTFCRRCLPQVSAEYAEAHNAQIVASWKQKVTLQVLDWQRRAIRTIGLSTAIGVTVGSTLATVAGAAAGLPGWPQE